MTALELVFLTNYFPNLGKIIIYQEPFDGNNGGYFKFAEEFM